MKIGIAIAGYGKIARDEHLPAIEADPRFRPVAIVTRGEASHRSMPSFPDLAALPPSLRSAIDAVAICTPPSVRTRIALDAMEMGFGVLLEKPPAATPGEAALLERTARAAGLPLYAAWHAQHSPAVRAAGDALAGETVRKVRIVWREDVRKYHPGQDWVWQAGGFGVFDAGINALSIATRILREPLIVADARLLIERHGQTPIAATVRFGNCGAEADFDWRGAGAERWTIDLITASGRSIALHDGGKTLAVDGEDRPLAGLSGYPSIYDRFAEIVTGGSVDLDLEPLRIVSDIFLVGHRDLADDIAAAGEESA